MAYAAIRRVVRGKDATRVPSVELAEQSMPAASRLAAHQQRAIDTLTCPIDEDLLPPVAYFSEEQLHELIERRHYTPKMAEELRQVRAMALDQMGGRSPWATHGGGGLYGC